MKNNKTDLYLIHTLLFLVPLVYLHGFGSYNAFRYFFLGTLALAVFLVTTWKILKFKTIDLSVFKSPVFYGFLSYFIFFFLTSIASVNPANSFFSSFARSDGFFTLLFLSMFLVSVLNAVSIHGKEVIRKFLVASVLGSTVLSIFIIFSNAGLSVLAWDWLTQSGGGAMAGNQSVAGSYVLWNIFFAIFLFLKSGEARKKVLWGVVALVLALSPLFLNWQLVLGGAKYESVLDIIGVARGAFLGIVFGLVIALGVWLLLHKDQKIKKYAGAGILLITMASSIFAGVTLLQKSSPLHQKFAQVAGENRFIFWDMVRDGFKEKPILGWGPSNFNVTFHKFFEPRLLQASHNFETLVDNPHNILFEKLNYGGILLLLSFLYFLVSVLWGLLGIYKKDYLDKIGVSLLVGAFAGWLLQAQFVFDTILSSSMLFLVAGTAYAGILSKRDIDKQSWKYDLSIKNKLVFAASCFLTLFLFIYAVFLPYVKNRVMYKTLGTKLPDRISLWKNLEGISPMGDSYDSSWMFFNIFKTYYDNRGVIKGWDEERRKMAISELDEIFKYLNKLAVRDNNYELIFTAARIGYTRMYLANDLSDPLLSSTKDLVEKAMSMSPNDQQLYWLMAQIKTAEGNLGEARDLLEKAVSIEPAVTLTHGFILELAKKMNDQKYYDTALDRAEKYIPGFTGNLDQLNKLNEIYRK